MTATRRPAPVDPLLRELVLATCETFGAPARVARDLATREGFTAEEIDAALAETTRPDRVTSKRRAAPEAA